MHVRFDGVFKKYDNFQAVTDLNLHIESGSLHFLLGPSGCGKTTALRMLAGLETPTAGRILFDDRDVTALPTAKREIGMVFQNYALWPHMTVEENVRYGLELRKLDKAVIRDKTDEVLNLTKMGPMRKRYPGQLSGGQQQRVALARALAIDPKLLLLDEPLSNLDAKLRIEMRESILDIHRRTGITALYVTHDQKEALSMGSCITVMLGGKVVQSGTPRELYNYPVSPFLADFIGEANLIDAVLEQQQGSKLILSTALGTLEAMPAKGMGSLRQGDELCLSVRPEAIKVAREAGSFAGLNTCHLPLSQLTYLGENEQMEFAYGALKPLRASLGESWAEEARLGSKLYCHIPPEKIRVLPNERTGVST